MPICKKCNKEFPSRIGNKTYHKRSYCLKCSPPGSGMGYEIRKATRKKEKVKGKKECPICGKFSTWTKNNVCSTCRMMWQRWKTKKRAVDMKGGKCCKCGETDMRVLTFHHLNVEDKEYNISNFYSRICWEKIVLEIEKCDLMCFNCHVRLHSEINRAKYSCIEQYYAMT